MAGILAAAVVACGDKDTGPNADQLAGTWVATKAEFVSVADPGIRVDLVTLGGAIRLVLAESRTFTLTVSFPGEADELSNGGWSSSVDVLTLTFTSGPMHGEMQFDMSLSGETLTLNGGHADFDVDEDGDDDPVIVNLTMGRQ